MNTCVHAWHDPSQCPFCREEKLQSLRGEIKRLRELLRDIMADQQTAHWHEDIKEALGE